MREYVVQSLLHALVAAAVVETLLRAWRIADPAERLAYRLLVLVLPLLAPPLLGLLAPFRLDAAFADTRALLASVHWNRVVIAGVPLDTAGVVIAGVVAVVLYVRDVTPLVKASRRRPGRGEVPAAERLRPMVAEVAPRVGLVRPPALVMLVSAGPVFFTKGVWRPVLVVSAGALARLDHEARRAAIAHELAHIARHDLLLGWAVMLTRTILVHNPIVQVVARAAVQEMERRADDLAARATGSPLALASAMGALGQRRPPRGADLPAGIGPLNDLLAELVTRGRSAALEARRHRLLHAWPPVRSPLAVARFVLTAAATVGLLFFVV